MAKAMSFFGMGVGALLAVVFGLDMVLGIPLGRASTMMDIGFLIAGLILTYMSWDALKAAG